MGFSSPHVNRDKMRKNELIMIHKGQRWLSKRSGMVLEVVNKAGYHWRCRKLTKKEGVYNGTHNMSEYTLRTKFILL